MSAPRKHLTPADIDAAIAGEAFQRMEGTQITLCVLTMRNGARVAGINYGSIDPSRQDWEQGARLARENAIAKVWELEGYALRERLAAPAFIELKGEFSAEDIAKFKAYWERMVKGDRP